MFNININTYNSYTIQNIQYDDEPYACKLIYYLNNYIIIYFLFRYMEQEMPNWKK